MSLDGMAGGTRQVYGDGGCEAGSVPQSDAPGGPAGSTGAGAVLPIDVYGRRLPPISEMAITTIAVVVAGGVYLAAYLPRHAPLGPAYGVLALAVVLLGTNVGVLARVRPFAWGRFFSVARWALLAYLVFAGILEYVFVLDGTRGGLLVVLTCMLAIYAVNIPLLLAFSVARYQPVAEPARERSGDGSPVRVPASGGAAPGRAAG
ncbi:MAG: hypothetical protein M0Z93_08910 [Actinomycetota bacterium]|jgi:hypothetical protein|nr:hypothetical protein [Actinomycetota bacterium]MDA8343206.1 hypothetical protein [Actinomycetota bacterium]